MSTISKKLNGRHNAICDYFKVNKFGRTPEDLTVLSLLPPVDRCLIIERVMDVGFCDFMACIDKLSMAYVKTGWRDIAHRFIETCEAAGLLDGYFQFFMDKLNSLPVQNVSKSYSDTLSKLDQYWNGGALCKIIENLCIRFRGNEILTGNDTAAEIEDFKKERIEAFASSTGPNGQGYVPDRSSDDVSAYMLANTQVFALCYLLGGARIKNFDFASSENFNQFGDRIKATWEDTESYLSASSLDFFAMRGMCDERTYLVSVEMPAFSDNTFRYRTSTHHIRVDDVVDLMGEVMGTKPFGIKPLARLSPRSDGEVLYRFSWMFQEQDVDSLLSVFPSVVPRYGAWVQTRAVFGDMDRILNRIARRALSIYPFMECEFTGW